MVPVFTVGQNLPMLELRCLLCLKGCASSYLPFSPGFPHFCCPKLKKKKKSPKPQPTTLSSSALAIIMRDKFLHANKLEVIPQNVLGSNKIIITRIVTKNTNSC